MITAANDLGDSRKRRIMDNMAEVKFRGTLSKSKLDKTLEYNISSPLKNQNFESQLLSVFTLNESRRAQKELKPVADLVREIIRPSTNPLYEEIRNKPSMLMSEQELELSHVNLREELKRANKFLTRLVERQLVLKSVEE